MSELLMYLLAFALGLVVANIKYHIQLKKDRELTKKLLDDDKEIIDEMSRLLVSVHEQANKSDFH